MGIDRTKKYSSSPSIVTGDMGIVEQGAEENDNTDLDKIINSIEQATLIADKSKREGILPEEHIETLYNDIAVLFEELLDLTEERNNAYKFLKLNGIDRNIIPNIRHTYKPLRKQILLLIKTLFNTIPATANLQIPNNIVDLLLDVFEHDDDLALKAHSLDILYAWLPNNPKLQARVMKLKGLEPFYQQMYKLDTGVNYKLLDLFNKILEEHIQIRNDKKQRNKYDYEKLKTYQIIGLIERMSTPRVCNGLLNIFGEIVHANKNIEVISMPVFQLLKTIEPFCAKFFAGKSTAAKILSDWNDYVTDSNKIKMFEELGVNLSDIQETINRYLLQARHEIRDEF
ncbi:unnamed protein product [Leptidea sinapis]|uniref:Uncharacterized protein n=1 Tax=Leptidea sinapis TaxID=189913 RepID=A0A5E4QR05_9NEOP|nr:unnamed protein product [Leptidea sinapis]